MNEKHPVFNYEHLTTPDIDQWIRKQTDINLLHRLLSSEIVGILGEIETDYGDSYGRKSDIIQIAAIDRLFQLDVTSARKELRFFLQNIEFVSGSDDPDASIGVYGTTLAHSFF